MMTETVRSIGLIARLTLRADARRCVLSFALACLVGLWTVLNAFWLKVIIDRVVTRDLNGALWGVTALLATTILGMLANWTGVTTSQRLRERMDWLIDQELILVTSGIPYVEHHERTDYLREMELLRSEKGALSGTANTLVNNFSTAIQAIAVGLLLAYLHPALLLLPLFALPSLWMGSRVENIRQRVHAETIEKSRAADYLFELATTAGPAKEIRIFGLQEEILERHKRRWLEIDHLRHRAALKGAALGGLGWLAFSVGFVGAVVFVVVRAVQGTATPGDVILVVQLTGQVNQQMANAVSGISSLIRNLKTVRRYQWLLDYDNEIRERIEPVEPRPVPERLLRGIELTGLSFIYPGTTTEVLKDVNLTLPAGATIAIVGENGAGKTTLVKLISRLYDPTAGTITVDDLDLKQIDVEKWRNRIATGFQDFVKFEFLARETVGVGDLSSIEDGPAVERALERADASDILMSLPLGLETQLGRMFEGGIDLSIGQWQKVALGRAMMRTSPLLLILDEPTASLDPETEHALFERYSLAARQSASDRGAITILVSHRFSTVRMAELIVVIDGGRILESGSHKELVERGGGLYAELYELQARRYL